VYRRPGPSARPVPHARRAGSAAETVCRRPRWTCRARKLRGRPRPKARRRGALGFLYEPRCDSSRRPRRRPSVPIRARDRRWSPGHEPVPALGGIPLALRPPQPPRHLQSRLPEPNDALPGALQAASAHGAAHTRGRTGHGRGMRGRAGSPGYRRRLRGRLRCARGLAGWCGQREAAEHEGDPDQLAEIDERRVACT
jgi:hypothetical protein